jgi:class 3 adenylate cyclase
MSQTRRLAAILAADVVGYSRLIGADEAGTLQTFKTIREEVFDPKIAAHHGRLVNTTGDGFLRRSALRSRSSAQDGGAKCRCAAGWPHRTSHGINISGAGAISMATGRGRALRSSAREELLEAVLRRSDFPRASTLEEYVSLIQPTNFRR